MQGEERLVDVSTGSGHVQSLSNEHERDLCGDDFVAVHDEEVNVSNRAADGMTLKITRHREVAFLANFEIKQYVLTGICRERLAKRTTVDAHGHGRLSVSVDDGGNATIGA